VKSIEATVHLHTDTFKQEQAEQLSMSASVSRYRLQPKSYSKPLQNDNEQDLLPSSTPGGILSSSGLAMVELTIVAHKATKHLSLNRQTSLQN
jgi:hypothetical protein